MAIEENVVIHVKIDPDLARGKAAISATLADIDRQTRKLNRSGLTASRGLGKMDTQLRKLKMTADKVLKGFGAFFKMLTKINFIGIAAEIGLVTVALLGVKLALVSGRFLVRAWDVALQGLGVAAAGAAAAIGTVTAALNEFAQVQLAPFIGGMENAAQAVRGVMGDDLLSFFGAEGLQGAITELAKGGVSVEESYTRILRQLGNFATEGKGLTDLAGTFAQINKEGKVTEQTLGALTSVNPVFASAIAEISTGEVLTGEEATKVAARAVAAGEITATEFAKALSGELESTNPFEGQLDRLNNTLVGQIKGLLVRMGSLFTDFGQEFLAPFKEAIDEIEFIVSKTLIRLRRSVTSFGVEKFIPGITTMIDKFGDFVVRMANEGIPKMERFIQRTGEVFTAMKDFFLNIRGVIGPLERGADTLGKLFGPLMTNLFGAGGLGGLIAQVSDQFADNADELEAFGNALGDLAYNAMGIFRDMADNFIGGLPVMTDFVMMLAHDVMPLLREVFVTFKELVKTVLPTATRLISDIARALLPVLQALQQILSSPMGPALGMAALGGGKFGAAGAAAGLGAGLGGVPGMIAGGLAGRAMMAGRAASGPRIVAASDPSKITGAASAGRGIAGMSRFGAAGLVGLGAGFAGNFTGGLAADAGYGTLGSAAAGAGGGLLAGAATGAAIGAMGGPIGMGAGALIGIAAGAIGGILAKGSHDQLREKAAQWAEEATMAITGELERELAKGRGAAALEEAGQAIQELTDNADVMAEQLGISAEELNQILGVETAGVLEDIARAQENELRMLERLGSATGKTAEQLRELADVLGINLAEAGRGLWTTAQQLGLIAGEGQVGASVGGVIESQVIDALLGRESATGRAQTAAETQSLNQQGNAILAEVQDLAQTGDMQAAQIAFGSYIENVIAQSQMMHGAEGTEFIAVLRDFAEKARTPESQTYMGEAFEPILRDLEADLDRATANVLDPTNEIWDPLRLVAEELQVPFQDLYDSTVALGGTPEQGLPYLSSVLTTQADNFDQFFNLVSEGTTTAWDEANALITGGAFYYNQALMQAGNQYLGENAPEWVSPDSFFGMGSALNSALNSARVGAMAQISVPANETTNTTNVNRGGDRYDVDVQVEANVAGSIDQITGRVSAELERKIRDARERSGSSSNNWYRDQYS